MACSERQHSGDTKTHLHGQFSHFYRLKEGKKLREMIAS